MIKHNIKRLLIRTGLWKYIQPLYASLIRKRKWKVDKIAGSYSSLINPGDLVFDIGANIGTYSMAFCKLGAKVVAVEPQSKCVKELKKKFGSKISIVQKGVSDKKGIMKLHICEEAPGISTFSEEYTQTYFPGYKWGKEENVEMTTLDDLIEQYGLPKYCKIDVEGFEYQALKGLTKPIHLISIETKPGEGTKKCERLLSSMDYSFLFRMGGDSFFKKNKEKKQ